MRNGHWGESKERLDNLIWIFVRNCKNKGCLKNGNLKGSEYEERLKKMGLTDLNLKRKKGDLI